MFSIKRNFIKRQQNQHQIETFRGKSGRDYDHQEKFALRLLGKYSCNIFLVVLNLLSSALFRFMSLTGLFFYDL